MYDEKSLIEFNVREIEVRHKGPSFREHLPQLGYYLSVFLTLTTCATGNSFNMLPLIMNIISMVKGKEPIPELPFKTWLVNCLLFN